MGDGDRISRQKTTGSLYETDWGWKGLEWLRLKLSAEQTAVMRVRRGGVTGVAARSRFTWHTAMRNLLSVNDTAISHQPWGGCSERGVVRTWGRWGSKMWMNDFQIGQVVQGGSVNDRRRIRFLKTLNNGGNNDQTNHNAIGRSRKSLAWFSGLARTISRLAGFTLHPRTCELEHDRP